MYGDSRALALSSDSSTIFRSNSRPKEEDLDLVFPTNRAQSIKQQQHLFMDSDTNSNYSYQNGSGLARFRSAPSSLFADFANGVEARGLTTSRFNCGGEKAASAAVNPQLPPQYPRPSGGGMGSLAADGGGYRVAGKMGSSLVRQNSSPAGLFSHISPQNERINLELLKQYQQFASYAMVRGIGSYRVGANVDLTPSSSTFKNHMNLSSLGILSRITEVENESGIDDTKAGNINTSFGAGFPFASCNDASNFMENFNGVKTEFDNENVEFGNRPHIHSHHLSLPKTPGEIAAMERFLQLQDTVPCKIRAKRGCATHPRSIAERVRRTRISERMRKLQDLVPNMDKQTNTADMLDFAVDYIKNLQKQYKTLSDNRANCKCSASQKPVTHY